jgi:hypothetical protein
MSPNTSWKNTIHHIDPASNPLYEILGCSNPHEIVWLISWKNWSKYIENPIHIFLALPN